jgi:peptidoglycan/xylan/chitin deacetylase (PgdA/CDA1 family)
MHATVFITSGMIGSDSEFWWDALENVFLTGRRLPESIAIAVNDESRNLPLGSPADRARAYDQICALLRSLPPREAGQATADLLRWAGADPVGRSTHLPLNREELKRLAASPCIEIGSHTVTHCRFTALAPEAQREELAASKRSLEEIIGKTVDIVSYPFGAAGDFSRETMRLTAEAGYRFGIANIQNDLCAPPDPFAVPRRLVRNWSGPEFAAWLASPGKEQFEAAAMSQRNIRISGGVHA